MLDCLLPSAYCLLVFRRVIKLAALDDILFVVVLTVAVDVHFDDDLVLLAVALRAGVETEAILAAEQRVDGPERVGDFSLERDREIHPPRLFSERSELIL